MKLSQLSLLALLAAGCTVPSLTDLEKEKPRACDDAHKCLSGYSCVGGVCQKGAAPECSSGATETCGTDKGECVAGTRTCGQDGKWGTCQGEVTAVQEVCDGKDNDCDGTDDDSPQTNSCGVNVGVCKDKTRACIAGSEEATCSVLSFGGEYQAAGETVCDGKDNDCDGQTDENLAASCGVDAGVCKGAQQSCRDGGFNGCTTADFLANSAAYEPYEASCDTLDNDCDGQIDTWSERIVSDAGTTVRRAAVGVAIPDAGTAQQRDVLAFYEEGVRVVMRQLRADGTFGPPVIPAQSVLAATRAYAPALASDGTNMVAAWFDEVPGTSGTTAHRLFIGLPRPDGTSFIAGSPGATPLTLTGAGTEVAVAVGGGRIGLAWEWDDQGVQRISVGSCPLNFSSACAVTTLATTSVRRPRIAMNAAGSELYVVYENIAQSRAALVTVTLTAGPPASLSAGSEVLISAAGEKEPFVFMETAADLRMYFLTANAQQLRTRLCALPCTAASGGSQPGSGSFSSAVSNIAMSGPNTANLVMTFEQVIGPVSVILYSKVSSAAGSGAAVSSPLGNAFRGSPIVTRSGTGANFTVLYDTEGATGVTRDVVWARRFCGP